MERWRATMEEQTGVSRETGDCGAWGALTARGRLAQTAGRSGEPKGLGGCSGADPCWLVTPSTAVCKNESNNALDEIEEKDPSGPPAPLHARPVRLAAQVDVADWRLVLQVAATVWSEYGVLLVPGHRSTVASAPVITRTMSPPVPCFYSWPFRARDRSANATFGPSHPSS
ncbi:hypothetical protein VTN77DRAFT_3900 [Rasamsonia byssochlamydoides]|uniref:uncharacterized protein n=1 Tax=Rasamsonia byssochlamydoides TaxID=89139 RepID=UPI0037445DD8